MKVITGVAGSGKTSGVIKLAAEASLRGHDIVVAVDEFESEQFLDRLTGFEHDGSKLSVKKVASFEDVVSIVTGSPSTDVVIVDIHITLTKQDLDFIAGVANDSETDVVVTRQASPTKNSRGIETHEWAVVKDRWVI